MDSIGRTGTVAIDHRSSIVGDVAAISGARSTSDSVASNTDAIATVRITGTSEATCGGIV